MKKKKIVLFEEFESIRNVLVTALEKKNYEVLVIRTAADIQNILNGSSFSLLIADNDNSNRATVNFVNKMRSFSNYLFTPVIITITGSKEQYLDTYKEYNIAGFLTKPFDMNHFLNIVERLS